MAKDANVSMDHEQVPRLRRWPEAAVKERQLFDALCVNYTAAYYCDLMTDRMELVKQTESSHVAREIGRMADPFSYAAWIRHAYDTIVIHETAPDYLEVFDARNLMARLRTEGSFVYRHRTVPNGAGMEYFEATAVRLYTDEHSFEIILGYRPIDDIVAEERENRRRLEDEVSALRNVHKALGSGAWKLQYDAQCNLTSCYWSDTMRRMLGFTSAEDFPNRLESWSDRLHPEDRERTLREYNSTVRDFSGKRTYDVEYRVMAKDGTYHWFRAAGQLSRRPDGSPIAFDGVFINKDELHETTERLQRALREAETAKNDLLLEHEVISAISRGYLSIYSIDLKRNYYEEISRQDHDVHRPTESGGGAQAKLNELCDTLADPDHRQSLRRFLDLSTAAERMGTSGTIEIEYLAADGNWHQARFIEKKRDENGRVCTLLYVTRIVSRRKKQEMEQERLRIAYLVAKSANEAKTTFLLNMSHDIRTPMNAILGYSRLMRKHLTDPELLHYQEMIEQSGNLLLSIINNVLDMARIESGKMELDENYSQVSGIVDSVCTVFEAEAARKGLTIRRTAQVEHPHIMCDCTKLQEILTNLISNAVKYTPAGGTITVDTRELPCDREGYVRIRTVVEDTGIGMSEEYLPQLFDSFSRERNTTTGKVAGSGLGMAIVKSLVDLMGGTIDVESQLGKGTKFTVTIDHKLANAEYYDKKPLPAEAESADFTGKHLLLAEDNDLNAEIAIEILKEMGFTVDRVEDGILCVDKLERSDAGTYDLILMDVQMPNMDGYKATQVIRRLPDPRKADIPIIAMTANAFEADRRRALEMGMNGHIAKPIDVSHIRKTLAPFLR